jgi:hypothetical protein
MSRRHVIETFLVLHTPTYTTQQAYALGMIEATRDVTEIYARYSKNNTYPYLTKREIERIGFLPPCGARVQLVPFRLDVTWVETISRLPKLQ